jgi:hypothetical protein
MLRWLWRNHARGNRILAGRIARVAVLTTVLRRRIASVPSPII